MVNSQSALAHFRSLLLPPQLVTIEEDSDGQPAEVETTRLGFPRRSISVPKARTGTSYLPADTVERAEAGSKFEKIKLAKEPTTVFTDIYDYAAKIRAGEMDWKDVEDADINTRFKWLGLLHRAKRAPGSFMMRLRVTNGIVTSEQMRFYADSVEPYA